MNVFQEEPFEVIGSTPQGPVDPGSRVFSVLWPEEKSVKEYFVGLGEVCAPMVYGHQYRIGMIFRGNGKGRKPSQQRAVKVGKSDPLKPLKLRPYCELF